MQRSRSHARVQVKMNLQVKSIVRGRKMSKKTKNMARNQRVQSLVRGSQLSSEMVVPRDINVRTGLRSGAIGVESSD